MKKTTHEKETYMSPELRSFTVAVEKYVVAGSTADFNDNPMEWDF